jgi:hypothetical protein
MKELYSHIASHPLTYVTRDKERALGISEETPGYTIISNNHPERNEHHTIRGTRELLGDVSIHQTIPSGSDVVLFKNTISFERMIHEHGWTLLNPPALLSNTIEEKISQISWLGELTSFLPPFHISLCKDLLWSGESYIIQFNHAHSGEGTRLIQSTDDVLFLQEKFPERPVRVTQYIDGEMFTVNAVVHSSGIMVSSPSYQITGISPFTDSPFTTIGNDWGYAYSTLSVEQVAYIKTLATEIGEKMKQQGWKGLFGLDIIRETGTGKMYLIEINARQPASTTYESHIQQNTLREDSMITTFEAHLSALLNLPLDRYELTPVTTGAQILQRITNDTQTVSPETITALETLGCTVLPYDNTELGSELLRIQTYDSLAQSHKVLSMLGAQIKDVLLSNT